MMSPVLLVSIVLQHLTHVPKESNTAVAVALSHLSMYHQSLSQLWVTVIDIASISIQQTWPGSITSGLVHTAKPTTYQALLVWDNMGCWPSWVSRECCHSLPMCNQSLWQLWFTVIGLLVSTSTHPTWPSSPPRLLGACCKAHRAVPS